MVQLIFSDVDELDTAINVTVQHVKNWTLKELEKILSQSHNNSVGPIIIPLGRQSFIVGNHAVLKGDQIWQVIHRHTDTVKDFFSPRSAVFFALFCHDGKFTMADEIHRRSQCITRLLIKADLICAKMSKSRKKSLDKKEFLGHRLSEIRDKVLTHKLELEKSYKSTKYYCFQDH